MEGLTPVFKEQDMYYCSTPVPPINDHKSAVFEFTQAQKDGYGQSMIHPSIVYVPNGWNGHKYWMAATPYPKSIGVFENACIYYADENEDGTPPRIFTPISGVANGEYTVINNPVVKVSTAGAINSDPDLLFDAETNLMYLVTRDNVSAGNTYAAYIQVSADGNSWTTRGNRIIDASIRGGGGQPSWVKDGSIFKFFYNSGSVLQKNKRTGAGYQSISVIEGISINEMSTYEFKRQCCITGKKDIEPYHSDVFIDDLTGYYYLITSANNYNIDNTTNRYIYLAESKDKGNTWYMYSRPLLGLSAMCNSFYRTTAFIRQSDRTVVIYWSTVSGIKKDVSYYPFPNDVPIDNSTIGLSYGKFDSVLSVLKNDLVTM